MDGVVGPNGQNVQLLVAKVALNVRDHVSSLKAAMAITKITNIATDHRALV